MELPDTICRIPRQLTVLRRCGNGKLGSGIRFYSRPSDPCCVSGSSAHSLLHLRVDICCNSLANPLDQVLASQTTAQPWCETQKATLQPCGRVAVWWHPSTLPSHAVPLYCRTRPIWCCTGYMSTLDAGSSGCIDPLSTSDQTAVTAVTAECSLPFVSLALFGLWPWHGMAWVYVYY